MSDERGSLLLARLDAAEPRLSAIAAGPQPAGETEPSPGGEETWTAAQVWGHLGEFPAYWTAAARRVLAAPPDAPATFGRTTSDPSRVTPIAGAAGVPVADQLARCSAGIADARALIASLTGTDWERIGLHVVRGEVPVGAILETFLAAHLEEHAAQLERLAGRARAGGG